MTTETMCSPGKPEIRIHGFIVYSCLILACAFVWHNFILGLRLPFHDTMVIHYQWREFIADCLQKGLLPFWDSWNTPGFPTTFLNAPVWNPLYLSLASLFHYDVSILVLEIFLLTFISALACYHWLISLKVKQIFSITGAVVWISSAPFVTSVQGLAIFTSVCCIPLLFLSLNSIITARYLHNLYLGSALFGVSIWLMVTGGYLGVNIPILYSGVLYGLLVYSTKPINFFLKLQFIALGVLTSFLLIAGPIADYIQVQPFLNELRNLAEGGYDPFTSSLPGQSLWTFFLQNAGYLSHIVPGRPEQLYIGIGMIFFLPFCMMSRKIPWKKTSILFLLFILILFASMGPESYIAKLLVNNVPLLSKVRHHVFWSSLAVFFAISMASSAIDGFITRESNPSLLRVFIHVLSIILATAFTIYFVLSTLTNGAYTGKFFSFPLFEIVEILLYLTFFVSFFIYLISQLLKLRGVGYFLIILPVCVFIALCWALVSNSENAISSPINSIGGFLSYLGNPTEALKDKIVSSRISVFSSIVALLDLICLVGGAATIILFALSFRHISQRKFIISLTIFICGEALLSSSRYVHGVDQWLGAVNTSKGEVYFNQTLRASDFSTTKNFSVIRYKIEQPVLSGDKMTCTITNLHITPVMESIKVSAIMPNSPFIVFENEIPAEKISANGGLTFSTNAQYSVTSLILEIQYTATERAIDIPETTLSIERLFPSRFSQNNNRNPYYFRNYRLQGDYDQVQFSNNRIPVADSYIPLFNPAVKRLSLKPETQELFEKLIWIFPAGMKDTERKVTTHLIPYTLHSIQLGPNSLKVDVDVKQEVQLIWTDSWDDNWGAQVNGKKVQVEKFLGCLKKVYLHAGKSRVSFTYKRKDIPVAVAFNLIGLLMVLILLVQAWRHRNQTLPFTGIAQQR